MKESALLLVVLAGLGFAFAAGSWIGGRRSSTVTGTSAQQKAVIYTCPMHPAYRSDRPGDCPMCGMRLVPVSADAAGKAEPAAQLSLQVAVGSLRTLGMSGLQISEIQQTRVAPQEVRIYSPINGFVISRSILPEQGFDKGTEMYFISDLSHVWVMAEIFEKDREFLTPGATATVTYQGREFQARMSDVLPQFDPQTRVFKTRFELDNPGNVLRPDLFVDLVLHLDRPEAITVPADAVIDSGVRKTLFVDRGDGYFEPRAIETGWRMGDQVEITKGVMAGERVVVSGTFRLDSETRLKAAAAGPVSASVADVVCGMSLDPKKAAAAGKTVTHDGQTYYF